MEKREQEYEPGYAIGGTYEMSCPGLIHGLVGVEAQVSVSPQVETGPALLQCVGTPKLGPLPGAKGAREKCSFVVHQLFSLKIPITLCAVAQAKPGNTLCEVPSGEYKPEPAYPGGQEPDGARPKEG